MAYRHLTRIERYQIHFGRLLGQSVRQIARSLNRSPSTVSRELRRNAQASRYEPTRAHRRCRARMRARARCLRIAPRIWRLVERLLACDLSPQQVSKRLRLAGHRAPSAWRIYRYINAMLGSGRRLKWRFRRPTRGYGYALRQAITTRPSIEQRPVIVQSRVRLGDWEADLMFGIGQKSALVTLVDRTSRYTLMDWVPTKSPVHVTQALISMLKRQNLPVHTLTTDNGSEFSQYDQVAKALDAQFFFAHPYASWERGSIENTNGLIRHYFPRSMDFRTITKEAMRFATRRLNHRPRKCLGFRTPHEVLFGSLQSQKTPVALLG